jgi:hypothetical protein
MLPEEEVYPAAWLRCTIGRVISISGGESDALQESG